MVENPLLLRVAREAWPIRGSFRISRGSRTEAHVVVAQVEAAEGRVGRGEGVPYPRYGETVDAVVAAIEGAAAALTRGLSQAALQDLLPAGAARNALDCALWDLEAKAAGKRVWELAGLSAPHPLETAFTLSLDTPEAMGRAAADQAARPLLKLKLTGGDEDLARVEAVRARAPHSRIIVDANEAWSVADYKTLAPKMAGLGVALIEQPLPAGDDAALADLDHPVPVCADESCHDTDSLAAIRGRYDAVNIKLDKTGGLTEALRLKAAAEAEGYAIMVGCMVGTSLAMAPATLVAQGALIADLDGPLLLAQDRPDGLRFDGSLVYPPEAALWG